VPWWADRLPCDSLLDRAQGTHLYRAAHAPIKTAGALRLDLEWSQRGITASRVTLAELQPGLSSRNHLRPVWGRHRGTRPGAALVPERPKVFFEEWDNPLISGIGCVSELVEIAGGLDIFADRRDQIAAKDRIVTPAEVIAREPDLIIGSWCGKKFRPERVAARNGFDRIPAVEHDDLYEIKSPLILQPGPAALTDGLSELQRIIERWAIRPRSRRLPGSQALV
jgi:hypothetical protein